MTKLPKDVQETIEQFLLLCNRTETPENEILILKIVIGYAEKDLAEGTCPNPPLLRESLKWYKLRLDELGAGEVRA